MCNCGAYKAKTKMDYCISRKRMGRRLDQVRGETILQVVEAAAQGIVGDRQVKPPRRGRKQERQFRILLQPTSKLSGVQRLRQCHRVRGMDPVPGQWPPYG